MSAKRDCRPHQITNVRFFGNVEAQNVQLWLALRQRIRNVLALHNLHGRNGFCSSHVSAQFYTNGRPPIYEMRLFKCINGKTGQREDAGAGSHLRHWDLEQEEGGFVRESFLLFRWHQTPHLVTPPCHHINALRSMSQTVALRRGRQVSSCCRFRWQV